MATPHVIERQVGSQCEALAKLSCRCRAGQCSGIRAVEKHVRQDSIKTSGCYPSVVALSPVALRGTRQVFMSDQHGVEQLCFNASSTTVGAVSCIV
eukprot:1418214-Alexandrium_andersonii.AAC.1